MLLELLGDEDITSVILGFCTPIEASHLRSTCSLARGAATSAQFWDACCSRIDAVAAAATPRLPNQCPFARFVALSA